MTTPSTHLDTIRAARTDAITVLNLLQEVIAMRDYDGINDCCLELELIVELMREANRPMHIGQYCAPRGDV